MFLSFLLLLFPSSTLCKPLNLAAYRQMIPIGSQWASEDQLRGTFDHLGEMVDTSLNKMQPADDRWEKE